MAEQKAMTDSGAVLAVNGFADSFTVAKSRESGISVEVMNSGSLSKWYIGYGLFLALCGIAGYAANPEGAKTALITGPGFGALMVVFGLVFRVLPKPTWWVALGFTLLLAAAFSWRATVGWQETMAGEPKAFTASLITAMLVVSVASLFVLAKGRKALASGGEASKTP